MTGTRKIKRHTINLKNSKAMPSGEYVAGIIHKDIGAKFATVVTTFEHLEVQMADVLAILLGGYDSETAGYVLRTLRNPKIKKDLLRKLLETAPINAKLPPTFDELLTEYESVAG